MLKINDIIIVEGKYDKQKLETFIDGHIIQTNGFRIFKDQSKREMIKNFSRNRKIIILTDSDSAGFMIRNHLKSFIPADRIVNIYLPQVLGKEKRKEKSSKEGLLGVEGFDTKVIEDAFLKLSLSPGKDQPQITKAMLFADGFYGGEKSNIKRKILLEKLNLPTYLSTKEMISAINLSISQEEYITLVGEITKML